MKRCPSCQTENSQDARFCSNCGESLSPRDTAPKRAGEARGERKPVTILFADIAGSTSIAEILDPEEWKEIVQGAHARVSAAIERYGGTVAQYLGDGALAYFGAPTTHEDDPERAVRAALELQASMHGYRDNLKGIVEDFQVRVGIHTGEVVLGEVGGGDSVEYLAVGDAVNMAARLQSAAEPGGILSSAQVRRVVVHAFELEDAGKLELKGKSEPVQAYRVVGMKPEPEAVRGISGESSPFVGRQLEVERLDGALRGLLEGHGAIVAVLGEAGIGKTRLVEEARRRLATMNEQGKGYTPQDIRWLEGRALSYGGSLANWVITQLLLDDLGLTDGAPEVRIKVALRKRTETLFGEHADESWPYLAHLFELSLDEDEQAVLEALESESRRYQTKVVLRRYFERAAAAQPVVLVLEDLHWADPSSLEVLEELLGLLDRTPFLILALMRIDHDHGSWALTNKARTNFPHRYEEIHLRRLHAGESGRLIGGLLGVDATPEGLEDLIQERAEGNPFYVEEVLRHLKETGVLVEGEGGWRLQGDSASIGIPDTLQGVLLARIDRLEEGVRETLQLASVIGRSFLYKILATISEAEDELEGHLTELQRGELVREKTRLPELEYMFKHALTQEAAYSSLLIERRKQFHRRVGGAVEQLFPDRQDEFLGLLAHHFEQAEQHEKAVQYLIRAGDQARMEDALSEAEGFYKRAINQGVGLGQDELVAHTWMKRALIYQSLAAFQEAHEAYSTAFSIMKQTKSLAGTMQSDERTADNQMNCIRIPVFPEFQTFDLSQVNTFAESQLLQDLFASLVEIDLELNVVPLVAKSWEILDQGKRYVFHLRDDVRWSNGEAVTAADFEWTLLNWIRPDQEDHTYWLDEIEGAFEFRTGLLDDSLRVGIRSIDRLTLELRLLKPTSYFIYLLTGPLGSPRYPKSIEKHGKEWWRPPNMVSNGPFVFTEFTAEGGTLRRNPYYFEPTRGNLDIVRWQVYMNKDEIYQSYLDDLSDVVFWPDRRDIPEAIPFWEIQERALRLRTMFLFINPCKPPTDDIHIRKAIAHAIDKQRYIEIKNPDQIVAEGGLIPPGIPGHSPRLTSSYDPKLGRDFHQQVQSKAQKEVRSLTYCEAGIPSQRWNAFVMSELGKSLGMEVSFRSAGSKQEVINLAPNIYFEGWLADFPVPVNFLSHCAFEMLQDIAGHDDSHLKDLLLAASTELDRRKQMDFYRAIDRYIVEEQAYFIPLAYGGTSPDLVKPWVKNFRRNALGYFKMKDVFIDQRIRTEYS